MYSTEKRKGASLNSIITYTLPKLHTGKNWYIDFKCFDPLEQTGTDCCLEEQKEKKYQISERGRLR